MKTLVNALHALWRNDEGQDLIEYALIGGLIALVAVAAITDAGTAVNGIWESIVGELESVPGGTPATP